MPTIKIQGVEFEQQSTLVNNVKIHYVIGGRGPAMLLIHGFPQTWWEWHNVMSALSEHYTVIAPDLRGTGLSDITYEGYTKRQLASDLHGVIESLGCGTPHVVGHDIGSMVAYAYATQFPTKTLAVLDSTIPGIGDWDSAVSNPRVWHFSFHQKRDLPEALICGGRERLYITSFIKDRCFNAAAISEEDLSIYVRAYSQPGAFRAGMEWYRQFHQDAQDNKAAGALPDSLKVLALGGEKYWGEMMVDRVREVAPSVVGGSISSCGHFIPEEQPEALVKALQEFCK